jgi:hypothetical protein
MGYIEVSWVEDVQSADVVCAEALCMYTETFCIEHVQKSVVVCAVVWCFLKARAYGVVEKLKRELASVQCKVSKVRMHRIPCTKFASQL